MLLIKAQDYQPDIIVQSLIVEKLCKEKKYLNINISTLISGYDVASNSAFLDTLKEYNISKCFKKNYFLLIIPKIFILFLLDYIKQISSVLFKSSFTKSNFFETLLILKYKSKFIIGDCICNTTIRFNDKGRLVINLTLFKYWAILLFNLYYIEEVLKNKILIKSDEKLFYCPETGYTNESIRRLLLNFGYTELRLDYKSNKIQKIEDQLIGPEIEKRNYSIHIDDSNENIVEGEKILNRLVNRSYTIPIMDGFDVDTALKLNTNLEKIEFSKFKIPRNTAVIFLHMVSDIQYYFGTDCFNDLHDWLIKSISLLNDRNLQIIIKLHPGYFNNNYPYPGDRNYLYFLNKYFEIDIENISVGEILSTKYKNIYFINHKISVSEISNTFTDFLCITHHGTAAIECAYLKHISILSIASPYEKKLSFIEHYSTIEEYELLIKNWKDGLIIINEKKLRELYLYAYNRLYLKTHDYFELEFRKLIGFELNNNNNEYLNYLKNIKKDTFQYRQAIDYWETLF